MCSQAPQTQNPVAYREAKTHLHSRYNGDWKKENGGYQAHLDPIWRLEWAQQTTIFRLRTGHCGLSAHLKRTGISDTSLCECGQADQTPDHVLHTCPIYTERRQLTWPQGADLAAKLWGSAEGLYRTAGYVASIGQEWYGHITRSSGLAKTFLHGTVQGGRRRGRQRKRWEDNICGWTGLGLSDTVRKAEEREEWRRLVVTSCGAPTVHKIMGQIDR